MDAEVVLEELGVGAEAGHFDCGIGGRGGGGEARVNGVGENKAIGCAGRLKSSCVMGRCLLVATEVKKIPRLKTTSALRFGETGGGRTGRGPCH